MITLPKNKFPKTNRKDGKFLVGLPSPFFNFKLEQNEKTSKNN